MRKLFLILGTATAAILVIAGIGIGVLAYKGYALDAESKAYVDSAVPAIVAHWSPKQFLDRATPELRASVKPEQTQSVADAFSRLGPFLKYEGAAGQAKMFYLAGSGSLVSASYVATARFRDGIATIRIALVKRDGHWMINGFHVDTSQLGSPSRSI